MDTIKETAALLGFKPHDPTATPTEKLDAVLTLFETLKDGQPFFPFRDNVFIYFKKPKNIILTTGERRRAIDKITQDGYLDVKPMAINSGGNAVDHYHINFTGESFLQGGGYTQQLKNDKIELRYKNWTTYVLIYGGSAAGAYYICQLLSMLHRVLHHCH